MKIKSLRQWERNRRETWNSFPFSMNEKIKLENMTLQNLLETIQKLIEENPERKNSNIICKYDGKISKVEIRTPTFDEMEIFDLGHDYNTYLFLS